MARSKKSAVAVAMEQEPVVVKEDEAVVAPAQSEPVVVTEGAPEQADLDTTSTSTEAAPAVVPETEAPEAAAEEPARPVFREAVVALSELPPNEALVGEPPAPAMIASVKDLGLLHPPTLVDHGDGTYTVAAGRRRIKAARAAGLTEIPVWVTEAASRVTLEATVALAENCFRSGNPVSDHVAIYKMLTEVGMSEEEVAKATGLTKGQVHKRMRLGRIVVPELLALVLGGQIAGTVGLEIAALSPEKQQRALAYFSEEDEARKKVANKLSTFDVRHIREAGAESVVTSLEEGGLFEATEQTLTWQGQVATLLTSALSLAPVGATDVRDALTHLLYHLGAPDMGTQSALEPSLPPEGGEGGPEDADADLADLVASQQAALAELEAEDAAVPALTDEDMALLATRQEEFLSLALSYPTPDAEAAALEEYMATGVRPTAPAPATRASTKQLVAAGV